MKIWIPVVAALLLGACGINEAGDADVSATAEVDAALLSGSGPRDVLIGFRPGATFDRAAVTRAGGTLKAEWAELGALSAKVPAQAISGLSRNANIEFIEEDRVVRAFGGRPGTGGTGGGLTPGPATALVTQGSVGEYTWGLDAVQATQVWDANGDAVIDAGAPVGSGVKVCVIDTGIDPSHPELKIPYQGGYDFVDRDSDPSDQTNGTWGIGHGTHVAGTIAAQFSSGATVNEGMDASGVVGVAPGASIYAVRVLGVDGSGSTTAVINGINWCKDNAMHVASLSLGSSRSSKTEQRAFDAAYKAGVLIFAANGNDGNAVTIGYPAGYPSVIAVAAVNAQLGLADFSQTGTEAELAAPGVAVLSTVPRGLGTSSKTVVGGVAFATHALEFSGKGDVSGTVVNCGLGDSLTSCGASPGAGFIAYVDRGVIAFSDKVNNVTAQGAAAVIIANNDTAAPDDVGSFTLGTAGTWIPAVSVSLNSGAAIKTRIGQAGRVAVVATDYDTWDGTSMATPHASAVGALVWGRKPTLTNVQVRDLLNRTAKDLGPAGWDSGFGYGLVQAKAAIDAP